MTILRRKDMRTWEKISQSDFVKNQSKYGYYGKSEEAIQNLQLGWVIHTDQYEFKATQLYCTMLLIRYWLHKFVTRVTFRLKTVAFFTSIAPWMSSSTLG